MVLAERNSELVRNGRRSRGPSPNGHGVSSGNASGNAGGPAGTGTPETSSDDDNSIKRNGKSKTKQSEYEEKIRVGRDYQAVCPPLIPEQERKPEVLNDRALLVWSPTKDIPDTKLEEYISVAKEKYGYNGEQALGMLFWHKHDLERAVMDLANFTPFPDEWTVEDKVLFEQAFQFHGKSFHRIRQMLPDKSIASLVKYYYSWKKTRHRQSVMDRQEKAKASKEGSSENGSDNGSNEESDNDDKDQLLASTSGFQEQASSNLGADSNANEAAEYENNIPISGNKSIQRQQTPPNVTTDTSSTGDRTSTMNSNGVTSSGIDGGSGGAGGGGGGGGGDVGGTVAGGVGGCCTNCGVTCNLLNSSPHGMLCASCHHHWRRTGNKRPTSGPYFGKRSRDRNAERHKRKPPRGMYINHDDIVALAGANDNQDELLANIDREIVCLFCQVQLNKQNISALKRKNSDSLEEVRPVENTNRINSRWTNDELLLAVQGVRKYGKDFQTIAETIGTKTEAHVRTFYVNYRRRYNLDQVLKKHEAEKEAAVSAVTPLPSNTSASSSSTGTSAITTTTNTNTTNETVQVTKNEDQQPKRKDVGNNNIVVDESDNTSSETLASKSTNDEGKSMSSVSLNTPKDTVIMEIDLEADQVEAPPSAKKIALSVAEEDFSKESPV